jgi:hypothetical protein
MESNMTTQLPFKQKEKRRELIKSDMKNEKFCEQ